MQSTVIVYRKERGWGSFGDKENSVSRKNGKSEDHLKLSTEMGALKVHPVHAVVSD